MKLWSKLKSPGALVLEGFLAGALIFFTLEPLEPRTGADAPAAGGSVLSTLEV